MLDAIGPRKQHTGRAAIGREQPSTAQRKRRPARQAGSRILVASEARDGGTTVSKATATLPLYESRVIRPECRVHPKISGERIGDLALSEHLMLIVVSSVADVEAHSARIERQSGSSLNPSPLRIIGTHFSTRADLVFACLALET